MQLLRFPNEMETHAMWSAYTVFRSVIIRNRFKYINISVDYEVDGFCRFHDIRILMIFLVFVNMYILIDESINLTGRSSETPCIKLDKKQLPWLQYGMTQWCEINLQDLYIKVLEIVSWIMREFPASIPQSKILSRRERKKTQSPLGFNPRY